jgi:hypothetical protein
MTTFVQTNYPAEHPGVVRATRAAATVGQLFRRASNGSLLLAAIVAAVLVVANQVIDTWTDGHLLAAWILMWAVAFGALALLAAPAGQMAASLRASVKQWRADRVRAAQDAELWNAALNDARVMADISRAMDSAGRDLRGYY